MNKLFDMEKLALSSKLSFSKDEFDAYSVDLQNIMQWASKISKFVATADSDVDNGLSLSTRADIVDDGNLLDELSSCTVNMKHGYYVVPKGLLED